MADISAIKLPDGVTYGVKDTTKQPLLVSGTNIKTINNESILGSGNLTIGGSHEELTQAQYDALSQAEKENGTVYFITDGSPTPSVFLDFFYPVGSYYETSDDTFDPNVTWGGTWELDSQGKVTVAQDTTDTAFDVIGETGGNKDAIVPYHNHGFTGNALGNHSHTHTSGSHNFVGTVSGGTITRHTISSGSGAANMIRSTQPFYNDSATAGASAGTPSGTVGYAGTNGNATNANLQPYIVVKRWHRTA